MADKSGALPPHGLLHVKVLATSTPPVTNNNVIGTSDCKFIRCCVFWTSDLLGIPACAIYHEIPGNTITDGTVLPTPPKRSAEALSRRTLLRSFGSSQIAPSTFMAAASYSLQRLMDLMLVPWQSARVGDIFCFRIGFVASD